MEIKYDKSADAAYFRLKKGVIYQTKKLADKVLVDLNKKGDVLGVEILQMSVKVPKGIHTSSLYKAVVPFVSSR